MVGVEADVKVTWNDDIEYKRKRRYMKKQGVMMSQGGYELDEEYSRAIVELVEIRGLLGEKDEDEILIYRLKCDTSDIFISWC